MDVDDLVVEEEVNVDDSYLNTLHISGDNTELSGFLADCQMAYSDLKLSAEIVETAFGTGDQDVATGENEDILEIERRYNKSHVKIVEISTKLNIPFKEAEERRRKFLMLLKGTKLKLLKLFPKPLATTTVNMMATDTTVKMPKIEIEIFSGNRDDWSLFKCTYINYIHNNEKLSNIDKFRFLKSKLKGSPANLIEALPLEGVYYEEAWNIILSHYDDPMKRISRHFDSMFSVPGKRLGLRDLVTTFRAHMTALKITFNENTDIDPLSQVGIHAFLQQADKGARLEWEKEVERKKVFPSFDEFIKFMDGRCNAYERAVGEQSRRNHLIPGKSNTFVAVKKQKQKSKCFKCSSEDHFLHRCGDFLKMDPRERLQFIFKRRLCRKCFRNNCSNCNFRCFKCKKLHNTLLHIDNYMGNKSITSTSLSTNGKSSNSSHHNNLNILTGFDSGWVGSLATNNVNALLATAMVKILNASEIIVARVLLDSASHHNFITNNLAKKLLSSPINAPYEVKGLQNSCTSITQVINVELMSNVSNFRIARTCLIVEEIADFLPVEYFSIETWDFPKYVTLADPKFNIPNGLDLLLGADIFWKILKPCFRNLNTLGPRLIASHFGWLVAGELKQLESEFNTTNYVMSLIDCKISSTLEKLWLIEETKEENWSFEESECEQHFCKTYTRNTMGRFIVRLPIKITLEKLGMSKNQAVKRFLYLEKRFEKDENLKNAYEKAFLDYVNQGHLKETSKDVGKITYYLPHHPVIKEESSSTKLRIVFDASMATTSGLSLNQCLMVGPVVQSPLFGILMRSRIHTYVFSADIVQMYRQILIHEEDRSLLRIFWRHSPKEEIKTFEHTTVTFGLSSAPYLATRCLRELAHLEGNKFPAAVFSLLHDFYVDDVFTGANSLETVKKMKSDLEEILLSAGFPLSKWCSNSPELLMGIPDAKLEKAFPLNLKNENAVKMLGLLWNPVDDTFKIWVHLKKITRFTKREVLSIIASVFDPLGFLGPVLVVAKLIMQALWKEVNQNSKKGWDEEISEENKIKWVQFSTQLQDLTELTIPRHLFNATTSPSRVELHGFSDASAQAYGAVFYVRSINEMGVEVKLFVSKSRVAPLKKSTIPRLELCAAVTLAELFDSIKNHTKTCLKFDIVRFWCDSEVVLHWIKSHHLRWQPFVANRILKIQSLAKEGIWDYVPSKENPADILSRGIQASKFQNCELWWQGPSWLHINEQFGKEVKFKESKNDVQELRYFRNTMVYTTLSIQESIFFGRYSNFIKMIRVVAWCTRFLFNAHWYGPFLKGPLNIFEIRQATFCLISLVQRQYFNKELNQLKKGYFVEKTSKLIALSPFLDAMGLIRVGGRLERSNLSFEQCHPLILPQKHSFTKLLINFEHERHFHAGPQLMKSVLRRQYWILNQGNAIQHCILNCIKCIKVKADTRSQIMSALPKARVVPSKAFDITGVDYTGPINLLSKRGRNRVVTIAYISIFVCFSTKAIHLELVSNLTTDAFIAALNRFIGRRGIPREIWSDNGANFLGAKNKLENFSKIFKNTDAIQAYMVTRQCKWNFIPPHAPSFGGLWEAGVKSVKSHLKKSLQGVLLTYEQFETTLIQIEACLNSRPLFAESNDPNEINAITPGHFLIGGPITSFPNPDFTEVPPNRIKYWELTVKKTQEFWKRWNLEYLNTLQQRSKWRVNKNEIKVGDVVLVKIDNVQPCFWPLGLITALHPGKDNLVRVVTVRMRLGDINIKQKSLKMSEFKRPVTKLVLLPFCTNSST